MATEPGDCENSWYEYYTWYAVDACDNESGSVTLAVYYQDTTAPEFDEYEVNIEMPCDDIDDTLTVTATDNCDDDVEITFVDSAVSGGCAGQIIRDYTAVDNCGNEASAQQIITLIDEVAPVATYIPQDVTIECDEDEPTDVAEFEDNCDDELDIFPASSIIMLDCGYEIHQSWTATDNCGNSTTVERTITVVDTTPPTISGEDSEETVECSDYLIPPPAYDVEDNCDDELDIEYTDEIIDGSCGGEWTQIFYCTATDDCENSTTRTFTVHYVDNTAPWGLLIPEEDDYSCDEDLPFEEPQWFEECSAYTVDFTETTEDGDCPQSYTVVRTWIATDDCGNDSDPVIVEYYVYDDEAPEILDVPTSISVECEDELPEFSDWEVVDNCDPNPVVSTEWEIYEEDECGNYFAIVTCYATDACGNQSSVSFSVSVYDMTAPVLLDPPADLVLDCDEDLPEAEDCVATDNCDDDVTITYIEEMFGDTPDPDADEDCQLVQPESPYYNPAWAMWLQDFAEGYEYYTLLEGEWLSYDDGTAHVIASVVSVDNADAGWNIDVWFENGLNWDDWSTQDFPTSYKCDFNDCGDNYLDWIYYIMTENQATMTGWGDFSGSTLTLSHAPSNYYYGYQVGVGANNVNGEYGSGGWFYYEGYFLDASTGYYGEVEGAAGDFAFDHDCCPQYWVERTWCAIDCSGNETCYTQTISYEDMDGDNNPPALPVLPVTAVKGDFGITMIAPNPAVDRTQIEFVSNTRNSLALEVYDLQGRKVATLFQGNVERGVAYKTNFSTNDLESGLYQVRLFSLSYQVNEKLVVSK
jgi:hypothetical protein